MNCCRAAATFGILGMLIAGFTWAAEPVRLTTDGTNKRDPRFIEGGQTLIYCYDETTALIRMMRFRFPDGEPTPVFENAGDKHHLEPDVSPDGRFMAYTQCTGNLTARLVIRDQQSSQETYVTHAGRGGTRSPVFAPDGKLVVYAFAETGPQQLWSVNTLGQDKKQLTRCQGVSNWPAFTPDGKRLVFSNSRENNYELYSMQLDGSDERRLTNNTVMDVRPTVSPDGKRLAFVSTRDGNYEVYVMTIDGAAIQRITNNEERDDYPCWHPNGRQLVMVSERDGLFDLYLADVPEADGT